MPTQPTILVKKADGTTVRMTLEEARQLKSKGAAQAPAPAPAPARPAPTPAPRPPVKPAPPPPLAPYSEGDARSLLEEDSPTAPSALSRVSQTRAGEVTDVFRRLSFSVSGKQEHRLRTVIQLYLKDVRSLDETRQMLERAIETGGVGLAPAEADEVIAKSDRARQRGKTAALADVPSVMRPAGLPSLVTASIPATAAPFNAFVHSQPNPRNRADFAGPRDSAEPLEQSGALKGTAAPGGRVPAKERGLSLASDLPRSVVLHDVVGMEESVGPVEEIARVTLTDFRRLAGTPPEAALRLKQKFINLRDESVILFFEAVAAWRRSPLYGVYTSLALDHLAGGEALRTGVQGADRLQLPELMAIVGMERELEML